MKLINECELEVTGIFDGKVGTKRENTIGGFICESEDKKLTVEVGSGFSDVLLQEISKDRESYIGKIVTVRYNVKSKDKHGNNSLFLPRLKEIRVDKKKADSLKDIK